MSANLFDPDPFPLRLNANRDGNKPLTVEQTATGRVDRVPIPVSGQTFHHTLAAIEENMRLLDETILELESIWAETDC